MKRAIRFIVTVLLVSMILGPTVAQAAQMEYCSKCKKDTRHREFVVSDSYLLEYVGKCTTHSNCTIYKKKTLYGLKCNECGYDAIRYFVYKNVHRAN